MRWLVLLVLAACATTSRPYVRSITAHGNELTILKCPLEFEGDTVRPKLEECFNETLVLPAPAVRR